MENPLISVVVVTWNRKEDVLETVQSIRTQAYQNVEIIVADNGSSDGTAEALAKIYPEVRLVRLAENLGASAGRNAGIGAAQGDIIFFLDSDASLGRDTLNKIVCKLQAEMDLGVIACKVVNAYTKQLDRSAGWFFSERDKADQDSEFPSYSFCSAGSAIRKKVIDEVGSFWDLLFIYREEDELSLRILDAGYKITYWPEAIVYHRVSPQKRASSCHRVCADLQNSLYIYLVRYPWWMLVRFVPFRIGVTLVRAARRGCLRQYLQTLQAVIRQVPNLWQQRRPISNETAHYYIKLQREHGPLRWDLVSWLKHRA